MSRSDIEASQVCRDGENRVSDSMRPPALRALGALVSLALVSSLLWLGAAPKQNRARFWIDRSSPAAADYQNFRARFSATELRVLRLPRSTLREQSRALTDALRATPGVLEVVSPSAIDPDWRDRSTASLLYGCDSTGACYHMDDERWAQARRFHGPLSTELHMLELIGRTGHLVVFARSRLDGSWRSNAADPPGFVDPEATPRQARPLVFVPEAQRWWKDAALGALLFAVVCLLALCRRSWCLALAAVGTAALAAGASEGVLVAARLTASLAEPAAEFVIFVLVLGAALEVLSAERARVWLTGAGHPWRAAHGGAGRSALGLAALGLGSASFAVRPVSGLQSFALQCTAGLLLGVALVSTLLPSVAALLPRQKPAPVVSAAAAPQAGARSQPWLLLVAFAGVVAFLVWMSPVFQSFNGEIQWVSLIGFAIAFLGLPLLPSLRHLPTWLQRHWPIPSPARSPEPLQRVLDAYLAALVIAYAIALPHWLTAAPGMADRLGPEVLARSEGGQEQPEPYTDLPLTRLEVVLTTPESQLTEAGLARLERLGARLKQAIPSFAVIEPGLFLREAAHQLERPVSLPGPWLAEAGLAGRLLEEYVTDEGHTARLTLLVEPPAQMTPAAFADGLLVESVAWQAKAELPDAEVTVTGPERLVAEAVFDPLRLAGVWVLAIGVAGSFQRLSRRGVPAPLSPPPRPLASSLPPVDHPGRGRTRREDSS